MKILITGIDGFIGKNMVNALTNDHALYGYEYNSDDLPDVRGMDLVIHLGAISSTTETDVDKIMTQNYEFSKWLYKECCEWEVALQYSSSASVYGQYKHFTEYGPLNPQSPYSWSKYLFDRWLLSENKFEKSPIMIQGFRYFNVYGQHEDHKGNQASPYYKFKQQALNEDQIKVFENSDKYKRDFVCVDDVVEVHKRMYDVGENGIFNVGTGKAVSFLDVAKSFSKKYNKPIKEIPFPDKLKGQYQEFTQANLTNLEKHFDLDWIDIREYIENE